jgi:hypothetical protein
VDERHEKILLRAIGDEIRDQVAAAQTGKLAEALCLVAEAMSRNTAVLEQLTALLDKAPVKLRIRHGQMESYVSED